MIRILFLTLLLIGCGQKNVIPKTVNVVVPVPCITEKPSRPILLGADYLKMLNASDYVFTITAEYITLLNYTGELEAVVEACD